MRPLYRAVIDEKACIGCVKCLQACPVDAIIGAAKWMHTVVADECTGCGLCVEPCPVDCITMQEVVTPPVEVRHRRAKTVRRRVAARKERWAQETLAQQRRSATTDTLDRRAAIAAVMDRMRKNKTVMEGMDPCTGKKF